MSNESDESENGPDPAELREASDHLRRAAEAADDDDLSDRLAAQADRLADDADGERGPDHGTLARRTNVVRGLGDEAGETVAEHTDAAVDRINAYREHLPGV